DRTKSALDRLASITNCLVIARLALDADGCFGNHQDSGIAAAACPLTVATMTIKHRYGSGVGLISDRAAGAAARNSLAHDFTPACTVSFAALAKRYISRLSVAIGPKRTLPSCTAHVCV